MQTVTETKHHLIIAHEVTGHVGDPGQLPKMAAKAKEALGFGTIEAVADAGFYRGADLLACRGIGGRGHSPSEPTPPTKTEGWFGKEVFVYLPDRMPIAARPVRC